MNKIINGKRYDTDKAKEVGSWESMDDASSFDYTCETLYRKRTGEFFLHCEGGACTPYASFSDDGWARFGEVVRPLPYEAAREWAEERMAADEYEAVFGEVADDAGNVPVTLSLPASAKAKLEAQAGQTSESQSAIVAGYLATEYKAMTDEEIIELNAKRTAPCIGENGCCYVVKTMRIFLEGCFSRIEQVTDAAVFATLGEARDFAAKMTHSVEDDESCIKHVYAVEPRWVG